MTKHNREIGLAGFYYDKETGDVVGDFGARPPRRTKLKNFTMLFHEASEKLARNETLGTEAFRVFLFAISYIDFDHRINLTQADIARELGLKQPNVNRAFKLLVEEGILEEVDKIGTAKIYRLAPEYGNKGRARNYQEKLQKSSKSRNERLPQKESKLPSSSKSKGQVA
jgi:DNA-binding transcriptional ArsR family regulator